MDVYSQAPEYLSSSVFQYVGTTYEYIRDVTAVVK